MARKTYILNELTGELLLKANDGELTKEYLEMLEKQGKRLETPSFIVSDQLGGINGIVNPADGKRYDSKSNYYRAVKAAGCHIIGNEWNNKQFKRPEVRGDFNIRPQFREALQKHLTGR
jgi:hypothetical protein